MRPAFADSLRRLTGKDYVPEVDATPDDEVAPSATGAKSLMVREAFLSSGVDGRILWSDKTRFIARKDRTYWIVDCTLASRPLRLDSSSTGVWEYPRPMGMRKKDFLAQLKLKVSCNDASSSPPSS